MAASAAAIEFVNRLRALADAEVALFRGFSAAIEDLDASTASAEGRGESFLLSIDDVVSIPRGHVARPVVTWAEATAYVAQVRACLTNRGDRAMVAQKMTTRE